MSKLVGNTVTTMKIVHGTLMKERLGYAFCWKIVLTLFLVKKNLCLERLLQIAVKMILLMNDNCKQIAGSFLTKLMNNKLTLKLLCSGILNWNLFVETIPL